MIKKIKCFLKNKYAAFRRNESAYDGVIDRIFKKKSVVSVDFKML
jgi:hypothetical protein